MSQRGYSRIKYAHFEMRVALEQIDEFVAGEGVYVCAVLHTLESSAVEHIA